MGIRHVGLRAVICACLISVGAGAGIASAQILPGGTANVAFVVESPTSIVFGGTADYAITITNGGPNHATDLKLTGVTLPAAPAGLSTLQATAVAGCTPEDATGAVLFPCDISTDLNTTVPQTVTVTITWVAADAAGNAILPTACPATTATLGDVTFAFSATSTPTTFTATGLGAGVAVDQFTDVGIAIDGPTNGAVGDSVDFTGTVTNSGACPAANVAVALTPGNLLTFQSGTGVCGTADAVANGCIIGALSPGQTVTFTNTYKISALPSDVTQTTIPIEYDVTTDTANVNAAEGVATTGIRVGKEGGGCNSGGPGGLIAVALMAAAVFAVRRRRTA